MMLKNLTALGCFVHSIPLKLMLEGMQAQNLSDMSVQMNLFYLKHVTGTIFAARAR